MFGPVLSQPSYFIRGPRLDVVLVQYVVQDGVQLLPYILQKKWAPQRQTILQVRTEIFVVQRCHLRDGRSILTQVVRKIISPRVLTCS